MSMAPLRHFLLACAAGVLSSAASAYPGLQLGILGASYNTTTETSVATTPKFKLYAFLTPQNNTSATELSTLLADTYYVSAALVSNPKVTTPSNQGSFTFKDGATTQTVGATYNMYWGTPPLDAALTGGDQLQTHGIFPTYFSEFEFKFNANDRVSKVDVQDNPTLAGLTFGPTGGAYYHEFEVDVGQLRTFLHFDLYNTAIRMCGKGKAEAPCDPVIFDLAQNPFGFAPFSHDAQSGTTNPGGGGGGGGGVPEPASMALVVLALGALGGQSVLRRRRQTS